MSEKSDKKQLEERVLEVSRREESNKGECYAFVNLGDPRIREKYIEIDSLFRKQVRSRMEIIKNMQIKAAYKNKDIRITY